VNVLGVDFDGGLAVVALLATLVAAACDLALVRRRARRGAALVGGRHVRSPGALRTGVRSTLVAVGTLAAGLALADPRRGPPVAERRLRAYDVVVCLDVSRSMLAADVAPTRLARARAEIETLVREAPGDRYALVVFAGEARVVAPPTRDGAALLELMASTGPDLPLLGGTDLGAALRRAGELLERVPADSAGRSVLLVTDGEDHGGAGGVAARELAGAGVVVSVLGLGSPRGAKIPLDGGARFLRDADGVEVVSRLDASGLAALAEAGGGAFEVATGAGSADRLLALQRAGARRLYERAPAPDERGLRASVALPFVALALAAFAAAGLAGGRS
jgi:Ca-activated chloride channel family protein